MHRRILLSAASALLLATTVVSASYAEDYGALKTSPVDPVSFEFLEEMQSDMEAYTPPPMFNAEEIPAEPENLKALDNIELFQVKHTSIHNAKLPKPDKKPDTRRIASGDYTPTPIPAKSAPALIDKTVEKLAPTETKSLEVVSAEPAGTSKPSPKLRVAHNVPIPKPRPQRIKVSEEYLMGLKTQYKEQSSQTASRTAYNTFKASYSAPPETAKAYYSQRLFGQEILQADANDILKRIDPKDGEMFQQVAFSAPVPEHAPKASVPLPPTGSENFENSTGVDKNVRIYSSRDADESNHYDTRIHPSPNASPQQRFQSEYETAPVVPVTKEELSAPVYYTAGINHDSAAVITQDLILAFKKKLDTDNDAYVEIVAHADPNAKNTKQGKKKAMMSGRALIKALSQYDIEPERVVLRVVGESTDGQNMRFNIHSWL